MQYSTLLAAALVCASIHSQNDISNYPLATNFTSRGSNGMGAGEILMGYHKESWRGIGQANAAMTEITKFTAQAQDQLLSTQEKYYWVVRRGTDVTGPFLGKAGEIYVSGVMSTPPSTSTAIGQFTITHTPKTPIKIPPENFFAVGLRLGAAPQWTTDGMSCHMAVGQKTPTNTSGAEAGTQQKDHAWDILAAAKAATHPSMNRSYKITISVKNPAFQIGNVFNGQANYGPGGLFPDMVVQSPPQGLAMRVLAQGANGQIALVFISGSFFPFQLPVFFGTRLYLHPTTLVGTPLNLGVVANNKAEAVTIPVIPSIMVKQKLAWQAILVDVAKLKLTLSNAVVTQF
jgi:hypothetical protein